jgi:phenylpropionate dioxygenase-like ring-hydroxylating dioxygenase large terminal subunit
MPISDRVRDVSTGVEAERGGPRTVAKERYTSAEYWRAEMEQLWPRVWLMAGLSRDLAAPGAYFTFDVGLESYLIVRQEAGLRAFHNVCLHRGRRLCESAVGHAKSFQCPYHGWTWRPDGVLARVPDRESFEPGFVEERFHLREVACEEWSGMVWICAADDAPSLRDYLGPVGPLVDAYGFDDYALVEDFTLDLACNWKVCVDAFNEAYHLKSVHPEILGMVDDVNVRADLLARHGRLIVPFFVPSPRKRDREVIDASLLHMLQAAGMDRADITGSALEMRGKIQRHIRARERGGDYDCSRLSDEQLSDSHHFHIFPNLQIDLYSLSMLVMRSRPHPTDPGRMLLDQQRFERFPRSAVAPPRPRHSRFSLGEGSLGQVTDQDMHNLVRVQEGMQSAAFRQLVFGDQESLIAHMHDVLDELISAPLGA